MINIPTFKVAPQDCCDSTFSKCHKLNSRYLLLCLLIGISLGACTEHGLITIPACEREIHLEEFKPKPQSREWFAEFDSNTRRAFTNEDGKIFFQHTQQLPKLVFQNDQLIAFPCPTDSSYIQEIHYKNYKYQWFFTLEAGLAASQFEVQIVPEKDKPYPLEDRRLEWLMVHAVVENEFHELLRVPILNQNFSQQVDEVQPIPELKIHFKTFKQVYHNKIGALDSLEIFYTKALGLVGLRNSKGNILELQ